MSSKPVIITLGLNDAPLKRGIAGARQQMRGLQVAAQQMGHGTVSSMQASSAAIRVLEGGITGNIRAAERFIGILPGIGSALKAAFPVIGGIALAGVFIKIGEEAVNFIKKMNEIPPNPFEGMIASGKLANDQLSISNDRLAMEIAKLEHKPANGMALALDQARESSDKLFQSLMKANEAFTEAMGKSNIGTFKGLWNNMAPTDAANKDIANARSGVQAITAEHQPVIDDALASGNQKNIAQARESLMVDLQKAYARQDAQLRAGLASALSKQSDFKGSYRVGSDQSKVIEKYQGALAQSANEQSDAGGNYGQSIMQPQKDALEAAAANQEAARKAQEALIAQWRRNLDDQKGYFTNELLDEARFWVQRMEESKKGSLSYLAALDEANKGIARMHAENIRAGAEFEKISKIQPDSMDLTRGDNGEMAAAGRDVAARLKSQNEGIALQKANATAISEASLQMEIMTGRISRLDAARVQATMHEQEYREAVDDVTSALAAAKNLPDGEFKTKTISDLNNQRGEIDTRRTIQSAQDQQNIVSQQLVPAMRQTFSVMMQDWGNMTSEIVQTFSRGVNSLNDDIVNAATGQGKKGDFAHTALDAGQGLVRAALQKGESMLFGGLSKPDGSKSNPIYTLDAGMAVSKGSLPSSPFFRPFLGGQQGQGGQNGQQGGKSGGGSIFGQILRSVAGSLFGGGKQGDGGGDGGGGDDSDGIGFDDMFAGARASGGDVLAGRRYLIGERGPEAFVPHTAGRIVPNHQLGGGESHVYHIDARGSNDPMAVHAAVARALPHAVAASVQAGHQAKMRSPGGR